jgi:hypothetical protein
MEKSNKLVLLVAFLVVLLGIVVFSLGSSRTESEYETLPELYVVGDSLALATDTYLGEMAKADGVTYTLVGHSGASIDTGMAAVLEHRPSPNAVVFISLGTNEPIDNPSRFAGFVEYVARFFIRYEVFWLNLNTPLCEENNSILEDAAERWSHLHYIDWKGFAEENGIKPIDQVHYDDNGTKQRAELMYEVFRKRVGLASGAN